MTSTKLIALAKERYKQLEHKEFEWRSFYNGFLEGFAKHIFSRIGRKLLIILIGLGLFEAINSFTLVYLRNTLDLTPYYYPLYSFIHYSVFTTAVYLIIKNRK